MEYVMPVYSESKHTSYANQLKEQLKSAATQVTIRIPYFDIFHVNKLSAETFERIATASKLNLNQTGCLCLTEKCGSDPFLNTTEIKITTSAISLVQDTLSTPLLL